MAQIPNTNQIASYYPQMAQNSVNAIQSPAQNSVQQTTQVTAPNAGQIYQYPTASLYDPNSKQAASGVNIFIYNPSGVGGASTNTVCPMPQPQIPAAAPVSATAIANADGNKTTDSAQNPIANTSLKEEKADDKEEKNKVNLTDDYIKTLENYLRSADANVRKDAIVDIIKRFEEDDSRYDNPSLTALLNIALQDTDKNNRMLAMSPIAAGVAHGDENTIKLIQGLEQSDKIYGQEAKMATEAALKTAQNR